jgi:Na+-transporting NADH:ubiquinone oxidoreductase subunit NqrC
MTRRRHAKNSAFAAVTAIVLLGLVASTLAAMAMMFAAEARRTRNAAADAQLRQLLIAGATEVEQRLSKGQTTFDTKLAAPADGAIQLTATSDGDAGVRAVVAATLGRRRQEQTLRFSRTAAAAGDKWKLAAVELR